MADFTAYYPALFLLPNSQGLVHFCVCVCYIFVVSLRKSKLKKINLTDFGICHRMVPSRMLYSVTLSYFSRLNISNVNNSKTVRVSAKMRHITLLYIFIFAIEWRRCQFFLRDLVLLHRQIFQLLISWKR